jgi:hypothetical protein
MFLITLLAELTYKRSIFCTWEFRTAPLYTLNFNFVEDNAVDHQQQEQNWTGG